MKKLPIIFLQKGMNKDKVFMIGAEENPCLPFIHSLSRKGIKVYAGSYKKICPGFFSRFPVKRYLYPSPLEDENAFVERVLDILRRENFAVTFVFGEYNSYVATKHKSEFERFTVLPINDYDTYIKCRNKKNTIKAAVRVGVPTPQTYFADEEDIEVIAKKVTYPVVLKPNISFGARGISYPASSDELITLYKKIKQEYGECHIQEFIPPGGGQYKAEILHDNNLNLIAWCVYEKIRYYPPTGGSSTLNRTVERRDILESGAKILKEIGWKGIGDCDFICDPRDNTPKLMEINSRITRSIKICILAGVDFPYMLYRMAIGERLHQNLDYKVPVYMRYLLGDILWFFRSKDRFKSKPSFFESFFRLYPEELFSLYDPLPFFAFSLSIAMEMLNKEARRKRLR